MSAAPPCLPACTCPRRDERIEESPACPVWTWAREHEECNKRWDGACHRHDLPTAESERAAIEAAVGKCCGGPDPFCAAGCLVMKAWMKRQHADELAVLRRFFLDASAMCQSEMGTERRPPWKDRLTTLVKRVYAAGVTPTPPRGR